MLPPVCTNQALLLEPPLPELLMELELQNNLKVMGKN